jgi:hypothetical protein
MEQYLDVCLRNAKVRVVKQVGCIFTIHPQVDLFGVVFLIYVLPYQMVEEFI